ncbi:sigma factor-like helix-turn-helix DNA-binding protein [Actinomadura sp. CNU-125]|uniref:sigma factor-like helix-turn-helix DNA-binding protein n=1 Tax=Actinomadura sp. CNU-125 TaxID=1904961 RepID=UPI00291604A3|nr:sigma factor-like helix-turn-helix DNA-binding protein [Actinomadura sp. CNU-125]
MPKGHRDALLLFAWGDLSYVQIAEALDVRVGTVRSRISRARRRLRKELGEPEESHLRTIVHEEPVHD